MRRKHLVSFVVFIFLSWNVLMYYMLVSKNTAKASGGDVQGRLDQLHADIVSQMKENTKLLERLRVLEEHLGSKTSPVSELVAARIGNPDPNQEILPILMIACDRLTVSRSLDSLLSYRPSVERFPIIVSQDCGHAATADVIQKYVKSHPGIHHIKQPDLSNFSLPWPQKKFMGYYKIARHYKWALQQIFNKFNYTTVIVVEDDLEVSSDFFEYFAATYPILRSDPTLWCVSAWNDNGKSNMVSDDAELLYRTDFFPGLGFMIRKVVWEELEPHWPETFWDDWMRHPGQRKDRSCIRPEICRTSTFGKVGVSRGLYFEKHLKFIKKNEKFVQWTKKDLSYLKKELYDPFFKKRVYESPLCTAEEIKSGSKKDQPLVRVEYKTKEQFKQLAKKFLIMDDFKAGCPRAAYLGVVTFLSNGQRVFIAPTSEWKGYDPTWT